jgi:large subunit ribosomal protein L10
MPRADKVEKVAELTDRIRSAEALLLADFKGLSVGDATELRRSLRAAGARLAVVKNTLMVRAASEAGAADLQALLQGPTAVAFVEGDVVAVAKSLSDAVRRFPVLSLKGAYMEGKVLSAEQAQALAALEPRPVLLARVAGLAKSEMARAAYVFQALQGRFLAVLEALREKLPAAEEESTSEEPTPAEAGIGETATAEGEPSGEEGKE